METLRKTSISKEEPKRTLPTDRPIRILLPGVFDMLNVGHLKLLEQAKKQFKDVYLIAGVISDDDYYYYVGPTVMTQIERAENLRHFRYTDEVINIPFKRTRRFLETNQIDLVCDNQFPRNKFYYHAIMFGDAIKMGIINELPQLNVMGSNEYLVRIIKDIDVYIERNLNRGYTIKEMKVSYVHYAKIMIKKQVKKIIGLCLKRKKKSEVKKE